jgi:hypothetical protein
LDLEVSDDAEQDENIKSKIKILTSASISDMILDDLMDPLLINIIVIIEKSLLHQDHLHHDILLVEMDH